MRLILSISLIFMGAASPCRAQTAHSPLVLPIEHQPLFQGERELLGYKPEFTPDVPGFDSNNRMYIRDGGDLQIRSRSGEWRRQPWTPSLKQYFAARGQAWNGDIETGTHTDRRVIFDESDSAFMIARVLRGSKRFAFLLHSNDFGISWRATPLPRSDARLVGVSAASASPSPPAILMSTADGGLDLRLPRIESNGNLRLGLAILLGHDAYLPAPHSGMQNVVARHGDSIFLVYGGRRSVVGEAGTPQFICGFDIQKRKTWGPVFLGSAFTKKLDNHAIPAVVAAEDGRLHIVFGSHHTPLRYVHSLDTTDPTQGFSEPATLSHPDDNPADDRHTYPELNADGEGNLHLITRWTRRDYAMALGHRMFVKGEADWGPVRPLVTPFRSGYAIWYHQTSIDRSGDLYLAYRSYINFLTEDEAAAYAARWPEHPAPLVGDRDRTLRAYDPVLLRRQAITGEWSLVPPLPHATPAEGH